MEQTKIDHSDRQGETFEGRQDHSKELKVEKVVIEDVKNLGPLEPEFTDNSFWNAHADGAKEEDIDYEAL